MSQPRPSHLFDWPRHPLIYEINTWPWLVALSGDVAAPTPLAEVSDDEWDRIAAFGCDAAWLMGVWERSPAGIAIALGEPDLVHSFLGAMHQTGWTALVADLILDRAVPRADTG